jgi:hypothetical protein
MLNNANEFLRGQWKLNWPPCVCTKESIAGHTRQSPPKQSLTSILEIPLAVRIDTNILSPPMAMHPKHLEKLLICIPQSNTIQSTHHRLIKPLFQAIVEVHLGARIIIITHASAELSQLTRAAISSMSQGRPLWTKNGRTTVEFKGKLQRRRMCHPIWNTNNWMHQKIQLRTFWNHSMPHLTNLAKNVNILDVFVKR